MCHNYIHLDFHTNISLILHHYTSHLSSNVLLIIWAISSNEAPKLLVVAWRKGGTHNFSIAFFFSIINQHPDSHRLDILILLLIIIKLTRSCDLLGSRSPYLHCTRALSDVSHVATTIQPIIWIHSFTRKLIDVLLVLYHKSIMQWPFEFAPYVNTGMRKTWPSRKRQQYFLYSTEFEKSN